MLLDTMCGVIRQHQIRYVTPKTPFSSFACPSDIAGVITCDVFHDRSKVILCFTRLAPEGERAAFGNKIRDPCATTGVVGGRHQWSQVGCADYKHIQSYIEKHWPRALSIEVGCNVRATVFARMRPQ